MKKFIFGQRSGIYIIDLEKTVDCLNKARDFVRDIAAKGGKVLFIGTKKQSQMVIEEEAMMTRDGSMAPTSKTAVDDTSAGIETSANPDTLLPMAKHTTRTMASAAILKTNDVAASMGGFQSLTATFTTDWQ